MRPKFDITSTPTVKLPPSSSKVRDEVPMPPAKSKLIMPVPAPTEPCATGPPLRRLEGRLRVVARCRVPPARR